MRYVPFVSYRWAEWHDMSWHGSRSSNEETRTRLWTLVKYTDPMTKNEHTTEARVIVEPFPDFCGGMIVHSPQVHTYTRGRDVWSDDRETMFMKPGPSTSSIGLDFTFSALDQAPLRALDMSKFTDKATIRADVEDFLWESMARAAVTSCLALGKRGIIAADKTNNTGRMRRLSDYMTKINWEAVPQSAITSSLRITDAVGHDGLWTYATDARRSVRTTVVNVVREPVSEWRNRNSGNNVSWLPLYIEAESDDHSCYESDEFGCCDCDVGISTEQTPGHVLDVFNNRDFLRGVPRNFWRNG